MRWRVLFFFSLGINVALGLGLAWSLAARHQAERLAEAAVLASSGQLVKTNVVVRRQFFSWDEVESSDYTEYVANLRAIGCPEQTIRDIIIADVNSLYSRRMALEILTPDQQWWRSEPDPEVVEVATAKAREIDDERRALLAGLLGMDWESRDLGNLPRPTHPGVPLDGPVLGVMPEDVKQTIQDISASAQDRLQTYLDAQRQRGKNPDPAELARLQEELRDELTRLLSPAQLEEYLLRYSQNAKSLRAELGQLKFLDASADEFRAVFRATDLIDQKLLRLSGSVNPNSVAQRRALQQQRESAIKIALGPARYEQYVMLHDPAYRDAVAAAQEGGDPNVAQALYQINLATAQQEASARSNASLTPEQLAVALQKIKLDQLKARTQALGQELPPDPQEQAQLLLIQQLQQQAAASAAQAPPPRTTVRIRPYVLGQGESVNSIARSYGLSVSDIQAANPDVNLKRLRPGDSIRLPDATPR